MIPIQRSKWGSRWQRLLGVLLQASCPLCQRSTPNELCLDCRRQLQRCRLNPAQQWQPGAPAIFAWGGYGGAVKRVIAALKYENQPQLARPLAQELANAWSTIRPTVGCPVVPIPLHPDKQQERGFNQADLLAQHFCDFSGLPFAPQGLARQRATIAQFKLSSSTERDQNLAGAFTVGTFPQSPRQVLLLDDIYTTGATVRSAAATLQRQGISVRGVIVVARAFQQS